jgi:glycosyltransferase involved in cell wall biosynthesis
MSAPPLVTVIVPVYDRGYCVMDAVHSVIGQTHRELECIVVDDGSTDDSYELVAAASVDDPRIRAFSRPHAGVSAAKNFALHEAEGAYVTFLDSDDVMLPDRIRRQLEVLAEQSYDAVIARAEVSAIGGASVPDWVTPNEHYMTSILLETRHVLRVGGFDETLVLGEDVDLLVRLSGAGVRIGTADETLTLRRYFGDNLTYAIDDSRSAMRDSVRRHIARRRAAVNE